MRNTFFRLSGVTGILSLGTDLWRTGHLSEQVNPFFLILTFHPLHYPVALMQIIDSKALLDTHSTSATEYNFVNRFHDHKSFLNHISHEPMSPWDLRENCTPTVLAVPSFCSGSSNFTLLPVLDHSQYFSLFFDVNLIISQYFSLHSGLNTVCKLYAPAAGLTISGLNPLIYKSLSFMLNVVEPPLHHSARQENQRSFMFCALPLSICPCLHSCRSSQCRLVFVRTFSSHWGVLERNNASVDIGLHSTLYGVSFLVFELHRGKEG